MNAGKSYIDFYNAIEKQLGIKQQGINSWIRKELKTTSNKN
jgi:hypothetical protein